MSRYLKSPDCSFVPARIALAQLVCALCIAVVLWSTIDAAAALSALAAGGISALSTWYMGRKVFNSKAKTAARFVQNIYQAQAMKLLLATALFCIVFSTLALDFLAFITTYTVTLAVYGLALWRTERASVMATGATLFNSLGGRG